jgi:hypothetical protein
MQEDADDRRRWAVDREEEDKASRGGDEVEDNLALNDGLLAGLDWDLLVNQ